MMTKERYRAYLADLRTTEDMIREARKMLKRHEAYWIAFDFNRVTLFKIMKPIQVESFESQDMFSAVGNLLYLLFELEEPK